MGQIAYICLKQEEMADTTNGNGKRSFTDWLFLVGRILYGGIFVYFGLGHFMNVAGMAEWVASKGLPYPTAAVIVSGIWIVLAGLSVIFGVLPRVGLWMLVLFLVVVTFTMHNFWAVTDQQAQMVEMISFFKNLGLLGAALALLRVDRWPLSVTK